MHSRRTGWTGTIDAPVEPRPHDAQQNAPSWVITAGSGFVGSEIDARTDTHPTGGLHKFDLGMVPASVTPPSSWRRAAWFAVGSSAAALTGLVLATSALVDRSPEVETMDLPGMPRGGDYPPLPGSRYPHADLWNPRHAAPSPVVGQVRPVVPAGDDGDTASPTAPEDGQPELGAPPVPSRPSAPPTRQPIALNLLTRDQVQERSDQYFAAVSALDFRSAYDMTSGPLNAQGYEAFANRYSGARSIEVVEVTTMPSNTITTLRITRNDGSVLTQRREVWFDLDDRPKVASDEQVP